MDWQLVMRIRGPDERASGSRPQAELFHDAPNAFPIGGNAAALEFPLDSAIAITGKLFMNAFDLLTKLLILVVTFLGMFGIGLVVVAAGSELAYLAGFRN
jgi:hypothetical protein